MSVQNHSGTSGGSPSSTLGQTDALALGPRLEAVVVAAAAAVPEASALVLLGVKEPHHSVVLAAARVLVQEAGVWAEKDMNGVGFGPCCDQLQRRLTGVQSEKLGVWETRVLEVN